MELLFTCQLLFSVHQRWSFMSLLVLIKYFETPVNASPMHKQTTRMLFFTGDLCERHQWRAPAALWLPLVYSLSRESVLYVGVQPCMPHPPSAIVFINKCLRNNRGTYCNYHLKYWITAGYKKQNKQKCNPHADAFINSTYYNTNKKIFRQILDEAIFHLQNHWLNLTLVTKKYCFYLGSGFTGEVKLSHVYDKPPTYSS